MYTNGINLNCCQAINKALNGLIYWGGNRMFQGMLEHYQPIGSRGLIAG